MRKTILAGLGVLVLAAALAYLTIGPGVVWTLAGPPDQGPVSFGSLERPDTPNTFLVCPEGLCSAAVDAPSPEYACPADRLFETAVSAMLDSGATPVERDSVALQARFVARTPIMAFPDTLSLRAVARGPDQSAIAVYSRSLVGHSDLGENRRRVEALLAQLHGCGEGTTAS